MEEENSHNFNLVDLSNFSVDQLLEKAESAFSEMSYETAKVFYQEAYNKNSDNEDLLCSYANFLTTIDEIPLARKLLRHALEVNIEKSFNYKKFVQMAELVDGKLSVQLYEKAIELIQRLYNPIVDNDPVQNEIKRDLSLAYSALAEIYQTDLLQFKESEGFCKENIEKALKVDPFCLDAYMQYANFYLNKEDMEKAKHWLKKLVKEMKKGKEDDEELDNEENKKDLEEEEEKVPIPAKDANVNLLDLYPISFQMSVIRLLIEVEEFEDASDLLYQYREEDDSNNEALYLQTFCLFKMKEFQKSAELMEELSKRDLSNDNELEVASKELKEEIFKNIGHENFIKNKEEESDGEGDGDWMDIE